MTNTKEQKISKYDELNIHILKDPQDHTVVEVAWNFGGVSGTKIGEDYVIVVNGTQLKAIDRHRPKLHYEFWSPSNNNRKNRVILRK